jgi:hypothetical protein
MKAAALATVKMLGHLVSSLMVSKKLNRAKVDKMKPSFSNNRP